jgi:hypothetical protein
MLARLDSALLLLFVDWICGDSILLISIADDGGEDNVVSEVLLAVVVVVAAVVDSLYTSCHSVPIIHFVNVF